MTHIVVFTLSRPVVASFREYRKAKKSPITGSLLKVLLNHY
ncbi:hypothetical protein EV677_1466 [Herminiimonas fonticola]|uniref:Uncharacterized protein n=1 Tax=Herminiimonas fonticola TaxID=303380 RepID=A0A4R6GKZ8_9BURK|nr:hypothetical protein Hfont_1430 [Herminiimonas fonticola]TDN94905.1 hypothetical protein EV677_1466 [Herminiimonas fonticola]